MKEYFFLKDRVHFGPYTIEQLRDKNLTPEILVWTEGFGNWKPVKEVNDLLEIVTGGGIPISQNLL